MLGEEVIAVYGDAGDGKELFEVQKLVRCKECKWYSDMWGCTEHDEVYLVTNPDDFCSIGERSDT